MITPTHPIEKSAPGPEAGYPSAAKPGSLEVPVLKRWDGEEKELLTSMLDQPSLFYWNGPKTRLFVDRFTAQYPFTHVMPCSSGTAAIHIAVAAAGIKPGDEVIVPPITDMGTVIGILYQQGVPVFADVDPHAYNLDPGDVRRKITPKTRAIIAVHLAGNPCAVAELRALADQFDLVLIEDCAQAWGAARDGVPVGLSGHIGCYSLNDFKHVSCGDGGVVASSDSRFGPLLQKFGDKCYDRVDRRLPEFLAPNYRISEPQSAVAAAQMARVPSIAARRAELGTRLGERLSRIRGIHAHKVEAGAYCTFWFYLMRMAKTGWTCGPAQIAAELKKEGFEVGTGYIPVPLYRYPLFQNHHFFGGTWPVRDLGLTTMDYKTVCCPVSEEVLASSLRIKIAENMDTAYVEALAAAISALSTRHYRD